LTVLTNITSASLNSALPDDGDYTQTCWRCFNVNFNFALESFASVGVKNFYNVGLTLSNPIFLPTAYSPALICFGRERGWWITCNYPTVFKGKNMEKQKEYNLRYLLAKVRTT
jgi:hypothetical protein